MAKSFSAQIDSWTAETRQRMEAVFKLAAQNVIEEAVHRTPRDTGFLVNSLVVNLTGPVPATRSNPGGGSFAVPEYSAVIAGSDIGSKLFVSWSAKYSYFVEFGTSKMAPRRFVGLSIQNWPHHVNQAVAEAKSRAAANRARK